MGVVSIFFSVLSLLALLVAAWLSPWRMLRDPRRLSPMLATLVLLPWMWALPSIHQMPLQLPWSGACLVLLMLGWPLAMLTLAGVGIVCWAISPLSAVQALQLAIWQGFVPASLALALGAVVRRWVGTHPFVYLILRAFLGTVLCLFVAGQIALWTGQQLPGLDAGLSSVAVWLTAWADAFVTGMLVAVFVAFKPQWLATWSDDLYLKGR